MFNPRFNHKERIVAIKDEHVFVFYFEGTPEGLNAFMQQLRFIGEDASHILTWDDVYAVGVAAGDRVYA